MHPHIPRPRRKATRTCTDTAGVVRTVHGELMWPFTARVNEKTAPIERIAAVAICRRLRGACGQIYAPPSNGPTPGFCDRRNGGLSQMHSSNFRPLMSALGQKRTLLHAITSTRPSRNYPCRATTAFASRMARPSSPFRSRLSFATFAQSSFSSDDVALWVCLSASFAVQGILAPPVIIVALKKTDLSARRFREAARLMPRLDSLVAVVRAATKKRDIADSD